MRFQSAIKIFSLVILAMSILLVSCSKDEAINSKTFALKQEFSVYENSPKYQFVGIAHAYKGNSTDTLEYFITSGNDSNAFSIDMKSGIITVNNPAVLDYEKHPRFALGISSFKLSNLLDYDTTVVYIDLKNVGIPANGLVSYFGCDNNLDDYISHKNGVGTTISYFYDRRGWFKSSVEFMGLESYAILDSIYDFPSRTICFWFKALNLTDKLQIIYSSNNSSLVHGQTIFSVRKTDTTNWCIITAGDATDSTKIYENNWYQAAITVNGSSSTFYLNGQQFGQQIISSYLHSDCASQNVTLGVDCSLSNNYYQGLMDELIIFNRALSSWEIRNCYMEDDLVY
jgi:hypothetical protein